MFGEEYSESPRLPSVSSDIAHFAKRPAETLIPFKKPWDAHSSPSAGQTNAPRTKTPPRCLIPEEDLQGHIEYKLRLPANPSVERMARLTSQLKWRLLEGGGEAIYELGVCDNGLLLGSERAEMDASISTLEKMAENLGAEIRIVREVEVDTTALDESLSEAFKRGLRKVSGGAVPPGTHLTITGGTNGENDNQELSDRSKKGAKKKRKASRGPSAEAALSVTAAESNDDHALSNEPIAANGIDEDEIGLFGWDDALTVSPVNGSAISGEDLSTAGSSEITLSSSVAETVDEVEDEQLKARRMERRRWKKERAAAKALERSRHLARSSASNPGYSAQDKYIEEALVGLFEDASLQDESPSNESGSVANGGVQSSSGLQAGDGQKRRKARVAVPPSSGIRSGSLVKPTSTQSAEQASGGLSSTRRFAVEVLVLFMKDNDADVDEAEVSESSDLSNLSIRQPSATIPSPPTPLSEGDRDKSRPRRKSVLPTFIDYERACEGVVRVQ